MAETNYEKIVKLLPTLADVEDKAVAEKIADSWIWAFEHSKWEKIEDACYSPGVAGKKLVDHVNATTEGALALAEIIHKHHGYEFDMQKILILGLMHDVCKLIEYEPDGKGEGQWSATGLKMPHGIISTYIAHEQGFDMDMLHLIVTHSHHIIDKPQDIEGVIFGFADTADTQIHFWHNGIPLITEI